MVRKAGRVAWPTTLNPELIEVNNPAITAQLETSQAAINKGEGGGAGGNQMANDAFDRALRGGVEIVEHPGLGAAVGSASHPAGGFQSLSQLQPPYGRSVRGDRCRRV